MRAGSRNDYRGLNLRRGLVILALPAVLLLVWSAWAASPASALQETTVSPTATTAAVDPEVAVLQAQLEEMRSNNDRLVETVLWSLGGMLTVVIAVIGVIAFFQFRLTDRDKTAIQQELSGRVTEEVAGLRQANAQDLASAIARLEEQRVSNLQAIAAGTQGAVDRVNSEAARLDGRVSDLSDRVTRELATLAELAATGDKSNRAELEELIKQARSAFSYDVSSARFEVLELQAKDWIRDGVMTNAMRTKMEMVKLARSSNEGWRIDYDLAEIVDMLDKGARFNTSDYADVTEVLSKLPEKYKSLSGRIVRTFEEPKE